MSHSPLRLVIFDVDGTLVDSQAHIVAAMDAAYGGLGMQPPPRETVLSIVGLSLPVAMAQLSPELDTEAQEALVEGYKNSFSSLRSTGAPEQMSPLYPGAREVIDALLARDDVLVGIATGKSRRGLDHLLAAHGLTGAFVTEQVADHHPSKPHPSMVLTALAETGVEARDAVMIGDTSFDMEMGRAARVRTLGVSWGYHPTETLTRAGAGAIVDRYADLPAAIERIWES
ncbi:HAD-IA family hydrolase [Tropicimonas sediminicola]|uniref:Phosphoglycolate phosphatase n=1 Tax=Tropicimonas sediminicola TaxID=1031541 RepID=A0A239IEL4_9RHOB|nr:HAD-IA family hydrolase [Tropicimonas sediminicola]SNS91979.1 phosphoglycolate phosphatase [Tropicimonas sediminicola]